MEFAKKAGPSLEVIIQAMINITGGKQCTNCYSDGTYYAKLGGMLVLQLFMIMLNIL